MCITCMCIYITRVYIYIYIYICIHMRICTYIYIYNMQHVVLRSLLRLVEEVGYPVQRVAVAWRGCTFVVRNHAIVGCN